jgi:predicted ArsR family transcriptional regulator
MGRTVAAAPIPVEFIQQHFALRQDGQIVRRTCRIAALAHEPAGYRGADGKLMVGVAYQGRVRRIALLRIAHVVAFDEWPKGQVQPIDGDEWNGAPENLRVIRRAQNPASVGASSLERRQAVDAALLVALAGHPDASVARLGELVGLSESGASTRLTKLERRGLTQSPQCVPGRWWALTAQGRAIAAGRPIIDDLDREFLRIVARSPSRLTALKLWTGSCALTVRRRLDRLAERGLVVESDGRFGITDRGRSLLGDQCPSKWVKPEVVAASLAKDVTERRSLDVMSRSEAARLGGLARAQQMHGRRACLMDERMAS